MNNYQFNNDPATPKSPNRTIAQCYLNGNTQIPLRKPATFTTNLKITPCPSNSALNNNSILNADRLQMKYEDAERKRKILLTQSEKCKYLI